MSRFSSLKRGIFGRDPETVVWVENDVVVEVEVVGSPSTDRLRCGDS